MGMLSRFFMLVRTVGFEPTNTAFQTRAVTRLRARSAIVNLFITDVPKDRYKSFILIIHRCFF